MTTDRLVIMSSDGRAFILSADKLPGGRGNGEAIRTFIDLPPEADIAQMFVHAPQPGGRVLHPNVGQPGYPH